MDGRSTGTEIDAMELRMSLHMFVLTVCILSVAENSAGQGTVHLGVQTGHVTYITAVAMSADGREILTADNDGVALLWDRTSGRQLEVLDSKGTGIRSASMSSDGRWAVTSDGSATLWNLLTGNQEEKPTFGFAGAKISLGPLAVMSADGRFVLTGGSDDAGRVVHLHDLASRDSEHFRENEYLETDEDRAEPYFQRSRHRVTALAMTLDASLAVIAYSETSLGNTFVRVWDLRTRRMRLEFHVQAPDSVDAEIVAIAIASDGRRAVICRKHLNPSVWDVGTGTQLYQLGDAIFSSAELGAIAITPDGGAAVTCDNDEVQMWHLAQQSATKQKALQLDDGVCLALALSPDGRTAVIGTGGPGNLGVLWDTHEDRVLQKLRGQVVKLHTAVASDGLIVVAPDELALIKPGYYIWDLSQGHLTSSLPGQAFPSDSMALTPDGRFALTAHTPDDTNIAQVWDLRHIQTVCALPHSDPVDAVTLIPDAKIALTIAQKVAYRWDLEHCVLLSTIRSQVPDCDWMDRLGGARIESRGEGCISAFAVTPDGLRAAFGTKQGTAFVLNLANGETVSSFHHSPSAGTPEIGSIAISPDGHRVYASTWVNGQVHIWDADSGLEIGHLGVTKYPAGHDDVHDESGAGSQLSLSANGKVALTSDFGQLRLWNVDSNSLIKELQGTDFTTSSRGISISPSGRYGLSVQGMAVRVWNLETGISVDLYQFSEDRWAVVAQDGRFDTNAFDGTLPLHWINDRDPMHVMPLEIFMRDYYTPGLLATIMKGEQDKLPKLRSIAEITNRVQPDVTLMSVTPSTDDPTRVDVVVHAASHLDTDKKQSSGLQDLRLFRDGQLVGSGYMDVTAGCAGAGTNAGRVRGGYVQGALRDCDFTFHDVQLKGEAKRVTFTAYAFNSERIKSATASLDYESKVVQSTTAVKPRAYLLQVGVNYYTAHDCELNYSVNDAEKMSAALGERLQAQGYAVEAVKLESAEGGSVQVAGKQSIREQLAKIAAQARPDDVFFMSFSGHGYSAPGGEFYILPSDVPGSCRAVDDALLKGAISADELADWLRPIDAGEMTLILDACYSAESVQAGDFKPGPLGSRGLGQLAYDKRMRVLAASQSTEVAHEYDYLQQGLLTYVLTHDGLKEGKADWKPVDQKIMVGEWLAYAADAVPKFVPGDTKSSAAKAAGDRFSVNATKNSFQVPALFDFSKIDNLKLQ